MTLQSRRKHPTTAPSTTTGKAANKWGRFLTCPARDAFRCAVGNALRGVPCAAVGLAILLGISGALHAQTEPAIFIPDVEALPIDDVIPASAEEAIVREPAANQPANYDPVAATALRWKSNRRAGGNWQTEPAATLHEPVTATQPVGSGVARPGWNITRVDLSVRPAQALQAADGTNPFSDPFGDRDGSLPRPLGEGRGEGQDRQAATFELEPTAAESGVEELPAPNPSAAGRSVMQRRPARQDSESSPPAFLEINQPTPGGDIPDPALDAEALGGQRNRPCDRVYNNRNCCDIEAGCVQFRNQLLSDSLKTISLDITPRFMPNLSVEEDEAERAAQFAAETSRPWRNRAGATIATGRLGNLGNNSVIVVDDSGREVARIPWGELADDELCYINAWWRLPAECSLGGLSEVRRDWACSTFHWHASALCHKPLYFEDVQLERYGHTAGPYRQPWISGAHFFLNIAALPYNMGINPPHECQYALGYYRPGSCAPWMIEPIPLSLRGAAAETATVLGLIYLIP